MLRRRDVTGIYGIYSNLCKTFAKASETEYQLIVSILFCLDIGKVFDLP